MKKGKLLEYAPNFEEYLQQLGNLAIDRNQRMVKVDAASLVKGSLPFNGAVYSMSHRIFLNGKKIGVYTEIKDAEFWGSMRRVFYEGRIPGYNFEGQNDILLNCFMARDRGYKYERTDGHKKIPFP